jgi:Na+/H+ antiporter NhaD/arsenite permease-like protein
MANVAVLFLMAPVAIHMAKKLGSPLFPYIVSVGVCANMVTTTTMIADPPALILAIQTGLRPLDFYWFQGNLGLGTITVVGVLAALLTLLVLFRKMNKKIEIEPEKIKVAKLPSILFLGGVIVLSLAPELGLSLGVVGFAVGIIALIIGHKNAKKMIKEFDWDSLIFLAAIFGVIYAVTASGILTDVAQGLIAGGASNPTVLLLILTWMSVGLSTFIDPNAYTVLMIPIGQQLATMANMSVWPLLFGVLIGTEVELTYCLWVQRRTCLLVVCWKSRLFSEYERIHQDRAAAVSCGCGRGKLAALVLVGEMKNGQTFTFLSFIFYAKVTNSV